MIARIKEVGTYEVLNLDPFLVDDSSQLFLQDGHWNALGHQVVADALAEVIGPVVPNRSS